MRVARFILSSVALLAGGGILFVSLAAGNSQVFSSTGDTPSSNKQFYISQNILPDHVAYPALMAVDRVKLETAGSSERIYLQIDYAQHRFDAAKTLLEQDPDKAPLALTTLTKSQKYLLNAGLEASQPEVSHSVKTYVLKSLTYYEKAITEMRPAFNDSEREVLDQLLNEIRMLRDQLQIQMAQTA